MRNLVKSQIPSTKFQINLKFQYSMTKQVRQCNMVICVSNPNPRTLKP
jgi:hypothetical protein